MLAKVFGVYSGPTLMLAPRCDPPPRWLAQDRSHGPDNGYTPGWSKHGRSTPAPSRGSAPSAIHAPRPSCTGPATATAPTATTPHPGTHYGCAAPIGSAAHATCR